MPCSTLRRRGLGAPSTSCSRFWARAPTNGGVIGGFVKRRRRREPAAAGPCRGRAGRGLLESGREGLAGRRDPAQRRHGAWQPAVLELRGRTAVIGGGGPCGEPTPAGLGTAGLGHRLVRLLRLRGRQTRRRGLIRPNGGHVGTPRRLPRLRDTRSGTEGRVPRGPLHERGVPSRDANGSRNCRSCDGDDTIDARERTTSVSLQGKR